MTSLFDKVFAGCAIVLFVIAFGIEAAQPRPAVPPQTQTTDFGPDTVPDPS